MRAQITVSLLGQFYLYNLNFKIFVFLFLESGELKAPHLRRDELRLLLLLLLLQQDRLKLLLHLSLLLLSSFLVSHLVLGQVVGSDESSSADGTSELLLSGVSATVTRQFVRTSETSTAVLDLALVRTFSWKQKIFFLIIYHF